MIYRIALPILLFCSLLRADSGSLQFGAATSDRLICTGSNLDSLNQFTWCAWVQFDALTGTRKVMAKRSNGGVDGLLQLLGATPSELGVIVPRSLTNTSATTNNASLKIGTQYCICATFDDNATTRARIFLGSSTETMSERTYATNVAGTGTRSPDNNNNLLIGNNGDAALSFQGKMGHVMVANAAYNLAQLKDWWAYATASSMTVAEWNLGLATTSIAPGAIDQSANKTDCMGRGPTSLAISLPPQPIGGIQ